jgi:two-component system nitrogen regulation response regulator GlnG
MLTRHFLQQSAQQLGVEPKRISEAALAQLTLFDFPGNVRQLENICHWLTVMAPAQVIEAKDLPPEVLTPSAGHASAAVSSAAPSDPIVVPPPAAPVVPMAGQAWSALTSVGGTWETGLEAEALSLLAAGNTDVWDVLTRRFESRLIQTALANTRGRRIEAAMKLGIGRNTITRKIQELGLE